MDEQLVQQVEYQLLIAGYRNEQIEELVTFCKDHIIEMVGVLGQTLAEVCEKVLVLIKSMWNECFETISKVLEDLREVAEDFEEEVRYPKRAVQTKITKDFSLRDVRKENMKFTRCRQRH